MKKSLSIAGAMKTSCRPGRRVRSQRIVSQLGSQAMRFNKEHATAFSVCACLRSSHLVNLQVSVGEALEKGTAFSAEWANRVQDDLMNRLGAQ